MSLLIGAVLLLLADSILAQSMVMTHSTYVGNDGDAAYDRVSAVAVDDEGYVYVAGNTRYESNDPVPRGIPITPMSLVLESVDNPDDPCRSQCAYVLKLDPNMQVIYGTQFPHMDITDIAVDGVGAVYATGIFRPTINDGYSATPGAFSSDGELFAFKISPDGSTLDYLARFHGRESQAISVDADGTTFVAGNIASPFLSTTIGAVKPEYTHASFQLEPDGFLIKIDASGSNMLFGTYLGGTEIETIFDVESDGNGGALVAGSSRSTDFVGFSAGNYGVDDAFVVQVSSDGASIIRGRFFGGSADEKVSAVSSDGQGGFLVAGFTESADFPVTAGVIQDRLLGQGNGWLARLDGDMNPQYATYLGGGAFDGLEAVTSDSAGNAYVVGASFSGDMLTTSNALQLLSSEYASDNHGRIGSDFYPEGQSLALEGYFAVVPPDGVALTYGTYLSGTYPSARLNQPRSWVSSIARTSDGVIYIGGESMTDDFPRSANGLRGEMGGRQDGVLVRFESQDLMVTSPTFLPDAPVGEYYDVILQASGGAPPYSWGLTGFYLPDGLEFFSEGRISGMTGTDQTETWAYQFTVSVTDSLGQVAHKVLLIDPRYPGQDQCSRNFCRSTFELGSLRDFPLRFPARTVPPVSVDLLGVLPPGITLDISEGSFGGRPTETGNYQFSFLFSDDFGVSETMNWELSVFDPDAPPSPPPPGNSGGGNTSPPASGGGGAMGFAELLMLLASVPLASRGRVTRSLMTRSASQ